MESPSFAAVLTSNRSNCSAPAATGNFDPNRSDVDLVIEFNDYRSASIADQWFGFQEQMEKLLGRTVDLTSLRMAKNAYVLEAAKRSRHRYMPPEVGKLLTDLRADR